MIDIEWLNDVLASAQPGPGIAALYKFFRASSSLAGIERSAADDLIQEAIMSTWQQVKAGTRFDHQGYLFRVLHSKSSNYFRALRRQRALTEAVLNDAKGDSAEAPASGRDGPAVDVQAAIDKLRARAVADRKPHLRDKLQHDIGEVWGLASGQLEMRTLIEAEQARSATPLAFASARDRLQKRHQYAREALSKALDGLVETGEIPSDQRGFYKMLLEKLLRRQNKRPGASSK